MPSDKTKKDFNTPAMANHARISLFQATQLKFGFREIEEKRQRFLAMTDSEREKYLQKNPVIVVLGPPGLKDIYPFPRVIDVARQIKAADGIGVVPEEKTGGTAHTDAQYPGIFVIDRHHESLALMLGGFKTAPIKIVHDFSNLTPEAFWQKMQDKHLLYHNPDNGEPGSFNDPYRSLVWYTRKAGGLNKVEVPYVEFKWADFFRAHIDKKLITENFDAARAEAMKLARSPEAKDLPGYIVPPPQQSVSPDKLKKLEKKI